MNKTTMLFPVLALLLGLNAFAQDPAFTSPDYSAESGDPLNGSEKIVNFQYPSDPCGTLMTEFTAPGSVRLGRGPVYQIMLKTCQSEDSNSYPNDNSVRTFACQNVASESRVLGKATFAFQCGAAHGNEKVVKVPLNRIPKYLY